MNEYAERVARGVLWLDHMHEGWVDKIDLDLLNLNSVYNCILGQMTGSHYWHAMGTLVGINDHAADMGFNVYNDELDDASAAYADGDITDREWEILMTWPYAHLENEWRKVLAA